jgi:hypothetical protein
MSFKTLDTVVRTVDVPSHHGLKRGEIGAVVQVDPGDAGAGVGHRGIGGTRVVVDLPIQ